MESSPNFLETLPLEGYIDHEALPRVDMENLMYNPMPEGKHKEEEQAKASDEVSHIATGILADDFFSSLELLSSSKMSSGNVLGLGFPNKPSSGIFTRSRVTSCMLQEPWKVPAEKSASKGKAKGQPRGGRKRTKGERARSRRRVKGRKKCKKARSGKKLASEVPSADSKKEEEEIVLEKSLSLEKCREDDDWVIFDLDVKKEVEEGEEAPNDLPNPVRRCTPELFPMNSVLISNGMPGGKDYGDNLLGAEDYQDPFLEEMDQFSYAPPQSHTGGKWKPGTLTTRASPMLWLNPNWDTFLYEKPPDDDGKFRPDTPADSPTEPFPEKATKPPPPRPKPSAPPATYTGGKWKPSEFPQRLKRSYQEFPSPDDSDHNYDNERESSPPPSHTGGKWKPTPEHPTRPWKPTTPGPTPPQPPKTSLSRSTLDVLTHSQSTSGKCLKTAGGTIQYHCSPCNRRLSSKKMYRKHAQSELHLKRVLQENDLECDSRSLKLYRGLLSQARCRERGLGKRVIRRPEVLRESDAKGLPKEKRVPEVARAGGRRVARREALQCEVCRVKVPSFQWGKHLVSYYHSRRMQLSDPDQQKLILDNIHAIVKQAPYQCAMCRFYCNTPALFKQHWALAVHKELEKSHNQRFWCALCSYESKTSRSMELHLDSNSHREVILAVNKSIPIIIRHKVIFNCGTCSKEFRFHRELTRHEEVFHKKADSAKSGLLTCSLCSQAFRGIKSLQKHVFTVHRETRKVFYFCSTCTETFASSDEAKAHRMSQHHRCRKLAAKSDHPDELNLSRTCSYCQKPLENIDSLKAHLLDKHTDLLPRCSRCGKTFALSQEVSRHVKNNECDFPRKNRLAPSPGSFSCKNCPFATNSRSEFLVHMALHQKKKTEKKVSCPLCGSSYTKTALSIHLRTHFKERVFQCPACARSFVRKDRYVSHLKFRHGSLKTFDSLDGPSAGGREDGKRKGGGAEEDGSAGEEEQSKMAERALIKMEKCGDEGCTYVAKDLEDQRNHNKFHIGPKQYKCPECSYSAKTSTIIKRHYMIHVDERSFPCTMCSFKARLNSHLKRHMRLHTGAKPYKCPHCPYTCNILENLRKHVLNTNIHPGKKLYECKLCKFGTNVSKDFKAHLIKNHKDKYKPSQANEVAGIYNKEEDCKTSTELIPVRRRASSTKPPKKASEIAAVREKVELLTQKYNPIAPKPSADDRKTETIPVIAEPGNSFENKQKVLQTELKDQTKLRRIQRSYPSPVEKDLKRRAKSKRTNLWRERKPDSAPEEEAVGDVFAEVGSGGPLLLNVVPMIPVAEEVPSKAPTASPQMESPSAGILSESVLPSEEMKLYLLEEYEV